LRISDPTGTVAPMTMSEPKRHVGARSGQTATVRVWDLPTRLFHWALVGGIASAWVSFRYAETLGDPTLKWHRYNGYAILVLLVFRVLWGIFGSSTSRWRAFVTWPWTAMQYGLDLLRGRDRHFLGHNPLGSYMILALLAAVGTQATLGLFVVEHNDTSWGPLYKLISEATQKRVTSWHIWSYFWVILPLIAAHILANTLYGVVKKDPLIKAMVTGRKPAGPYEDSAEATIARTVWLTAAACFAAAIGIVFGGIAALGGKLFY
jgi:cytochrome b